MKRFASFSSFRLRSHGLLRTISAFAAAATVALATTARADETEPGAPCETSPPTEIRSIPVFATGVFFDVIGAAALVGGTGVLVASHECGPEIQCSVSGTVVDLGGIAVMTAGGILLAVGIPLTVVGGQSFPVEPKVGRTSAVRIAF